MDSDSDTFEEGARPTPPLKEEQPVLVKARSGRSGRKKAVGLSPHVPRTVGGKCISCDAALKPGMKFCNRCGAAQQPVVKEEEEVVEEVIEEVVEEYVVEEAVEPPKAQPVPRPVRAVAEPMIDADGDEEEDASGVDDDDSGSSKRRSSARSPRSPRSPRVKVPVSVALDTKRASAAAAAAADDSDKASALKRGSQSARGASSGSGVVAEAKSAEMAEMAQFFEKHRLTRERLEGAASLLLDKLKRLQGEPKGSMIDPHDWEEYDTTDPLFAFVALSQEARNLYLPRSIEVLKEPPSPLVFYREYVAQNVPVVVRNAAKSWAAPSLWTNAYLRKAMGDAVVSVDATPKGRGDYVRKDKFVLPERRQMRLGDFLDVLEGKVRVRGNLYLSAQNGNFVSEFGPLHKDVEAHVGWATEAFGCRPEVTNIWIGDANAVSSCHKDHYENVYIVVAGEKHFTLLPPTDYPWLYEKRYATARFRQDAAGKWRVYDEPGAAKVPWISVDPDQPDLAQFPLFSHCHPFKVTVKAGEMLYLPSMWYHQVSQSPDAEGRCIAVNYWHDMRYNLAFNYRNFLVNSWALHDK